MSMRVLSKNRHGKVNVVCALILFGDAIGLAIGNDLSISVSCSRLLGASSVVCTAVKVDEKDEVKGEQSASV
jgi:hypothetical protein